MIRRVIFGTVLGALMLGTPMVEAQKHAGKMDTDGHLSPGELRNPRIDYGDRVYDRSDIWRDRRGSDYSDRDHDHDRYSSRRHPSDGHSRYDYPRVGGAFEGMLRDGIRSGRISRREEMELRDRHASLIRREHDYRRNGISPSEWEELREREDDLRSKFEHEYGDGEKRW